MHVENWTDCLDKIAQPENVTTEFWKCFKAEFIDMADRLTRYEAALREIEDGCAPPNKCVYCDEAHEAAKTALGDTQ